MTNKTPNKILNSHINRLHKAAVLVVGDIMLDRFIYGSVDRISPESPVPILTIKKQEEMLGGAGNALANLEGLGAQGVILSVTGEDEEGVTIRNNIKKRGLSADGLFMDADRPTIIKTRFLAGHQQLLRTDQEKILPVSEELAEKILEKAEELIPSMNAVLISDYGKGLLGKDLIAGIIKAAKRHKCPVIVDPKGRDFTIYKGATAITPNKKELAEATGLPVETDEEIIEAAQSLIKNCGIDAVVATRSAQGMSVVSRKDEIAHFPAAAIEVFDVSGAGDTVIATIAAALAVDAPLVEAVELANYAGSVVVAKVGTARIMAKELRDALDQNVTATICDDQEALEQVKRWHAKGLRVGFTNGCFDILHHGHVSYLNDAHSRCDRLIVGLNHDQSVKILKGPERPIHDEISRASVLAALSSVDMVVFFGAEEVGDDNTASNLLSILQPDVYFKGGDYTEDQIPEAPTVKSYGGNVCIMPVYEGHSTTASIERAKKKPPAA